MADLQVDTATLRAAGSSLRSVHQEFGSAAEAARPDRDVVAHPALRRRLEEFADTWDDRRDEMTRSIEVLSKAAEVAAEAYDNVESELVAALEGK
jgi:hypothetical protein